MTSTRLVNAFICISFPIEAFKQGFETLQWQWIAFIIPYHTISHAEIAPEIWHFHVILGGYGMVYPIMGCTILLTQKFFAFYGHIGKVCSSSEAMNGCP